MPEKSLPARPNLEQYKKQAKDLLRTCRAAEPAALHRLHQHHPNPPQGRIALSDAQLVLAREHGFESWPKFAAHIETLRIQQAVAAVADPIAAFLIAALVPREGWHQSGALEEANALLARYPHVASATIHTAAVLGDDAAVREFLAADSAAATAPGGPYNWDPLLSLCFSRYLRLDKPRSDAFTRTASALLEAGANPNTCWWETIDKDTTPRQIPETAIYGAAGIAQHPGVTRLLLDHGADPNDEETPYHVPEGYDNTVLQILLESGKLNAQSKMLALVRKADWHDEHGMELALQHGTNPNAALWSGDNALHHAIRRDNGGIIIRLLLDHGADPLLRSKRTGLTAAQIAARRGRGDVLCLLAERNVDPQLEGLDRLLAACALADPDAIRALTSAEPELTSQLVAEGGPLLGHFAGNGNTEGVRCLLDLGVPVDALIEADNYYDIAKDATALHAAAWRGWPQTVKLLLERGAPVNALDSKGRTPLQLAVRAGTDSYWKDRRSPEWIEPLLKAGASIAGIEIPCGYDEADALLRNADHNQEE